MRICIALLLLCGSVPADDFRWTITEGPAAFSWSITEKGGDPTAAGSGAVPLAPVPELSICPCLGYRGREHCYCLQRGVPCRCNRTTGSEWNMDDGKPVSKTGRYADPRVDATVARSDAPAASAPSGRDVPTKRTDGNWWWEFNGRGYYSAVEPTEGREFQASDATFVVTGGRMVLKGSVMAADIAPKGHFEMRRQCVGGVCRMYRVWVSE